MTITYPGLVVLNLLSPSSTHAPFVPAISPPQRSHALCHPNSDPRNLDPACPSDEMTSANLSDHLLVTKRSECFSALLPLSLQNVTLPTAHFPEKPCPPGRPRAPSSTRLRNASLRPCPSLQETRSRGMSIHSPVAIPINLLAFPEPLFLARSAPKLQIHTKCPRASRSPVSRAPANMLKRSHSQASRLLLLQSSPSRPEPPLPPPAAEHTLGGHPMPAFPHCLTPSTPVPCGVHSCHVTATANLPPDPRNSFQPFLSSPVTSPTPRSPPRSQNDFPGAPCRFRGLNFPVT